jgi:hypothetical protein
MSTSNLATALAAFQSEMPVVAKSKTAKVPTKSGGSYSYTYADLADVTDAAMPLLAKNGLSFSACPRLGERGYELVGVLMHSSGEKQEGALPIAGNTPQEMGSSLTYMRRYLLGCMTGIVTDDDDDGHLAQKAKPRKAAAPKATSESPYLNTSGALAKRMFALLGDAGITDRDLRLAFVAETVGREISGSKEMTDHDAEVVIKRLEDMLSKPFPKEEQ